MGSIRAAARAKGQGFTAVCSSFNHFIHLNSHRVRLSAQLRHCMLLINLICVFRQTKKHVGCRSSASFSVSFECTLTECKNSTAVGWSLRGAQGHAASCAVPLCECTMLSPNKLGNRPYETTTHVSMRPCAHADQAHCTWQPRAAEKGQRTSASGARITGIFTGSVSNVKRHICQ